MIKEELPVMTFPLVSVIIPVYRVEKYFERCLVSLFEQTIEHIEYIFINDKTPDSSIDVLYRVLEKYPHRKEQVKIIENEVNVGSATSRNRGILVATGLYIIHCDGDDWVEPDMYEKLLEKGIEENADIIVCDFGYQFIDQFVFVSQVLPVNNRECMRGLLEGRIHGSCCNKLIKRNLYSEYSISFPDNCNMWEDFATIIKLFFFAEKISYLPKAFYHYVQYNPKSYTQKVKPSSLENMKQVVEIVENFLIAQQCIREFQDSLYCLKIFTRLQLVCYSRGRYRMDNFSLYPEANKMIFKHNKLPFHYKLLLWCGAHHGEYVSAIVLDFINFLKGKYKND